MRARRGRSLAVAIGLASAAACSDAGGRAGADAEPYAFVQLDQVSFLLETTVCSEPGTATVAESADEVRIDDVRRGDAIDGDCLGSVWIDLAAPLGRRSVVVDGEPWVRVDDDCELAIYASADPDAPRPWPLPVPCDDS